MNLSTTGSGKRTPCRQTIWRRKKRAELQERASDLELGEYPDPEGERLAELEGERAEMDEMIEENEEVRHKEIGTAERGGREVEDEERIADEELEPRWQQARDPECEEEEAHEVDDMDEAVKCWPVLSMYQSTRFKYRILTKGLYNPTNAANQIS